MSFELAKKNEFLQYLRDHDLEEGRAFLTEHRAELADDCELFGQMLAEEAIARLYASFLSLKLADLLVFFGDYVQNTLLRALGLKAKGDALVQVRLYQAALENLDNSAELFLHLGNQAEWARTRISWMIAAASLGRVEEALSEAAKAREIFRQQAQPYWVCVIDHNTAWVYRQVGRYQEAQMLYERILTIYPGLQDRSEVFIERAMAMAKSSMAINLSLLGDFDQAYRLQQEALETYRGLAEMDMAVNAEITLADFDHSQGYYGSAIQGYYRAQALLAEHHIENPKLVAYVKLQIASTLVKINRANEARPIVHEAVEIYRQLGISLDAMNALRDYATVLAALGLSSEALTVFDEAEALFARSGLEHHTLITKLQRTELFLSMRRFEQAHEDASTLLAVFEKQGLIARAVRASLIMVESLLALAEDEKDEARRHAHLREAALLAKQAALRAQRHHLQEEVYRSQSLLGRLFALEGDVVKALRRYRVAIERIERILDDLLYDLSPSFLRTAWEVYAEIIGLYLRQGQSALAFAYLERARSMALRQYLRGAHAEYRAEVPEGENAELAEEVREKNTLLLNTQEELKKWQERYHKQSVLLEQMDSSLVSLVDQETLHEELKRCEGQVNELFERLYLQQASGMLAPGQKRASPSPRTDLAEVTRLQQKLAPNQLMLAYFLYEERLVIFALTADRLSTHEIPDGARQLKRLLPLLHAHLQPAGWSDPQQPPQQGIRQMLRKLFALLIAPVQAILPEPSGHLVIVPYGPLHTLPFHALYDGTNFLIEQYQVSYLPACNLFSQSAEGAASISSDKRRRSPLIFGYSGKGQLQYALEEARALACLLDAPCYLEEEASIERLNRLAPESVLIHLATHGQSRLDVPNFSAVTLADGRFNAIDAFSLDLRGCELVTLSGCETGLALTSGGDEQVGLGRAFLAAGAETLVMSLWPVEDSMTCRLMQLFYQKLLQGCSKAQALCEAQRALIRENSTLSAHPYYWAAFRLVGDTDCVRQWSAQ